MNKYTPADRQERERAAKRVAFRVKSRSMRCYTCQRDTPHYDNGRVGVNGKVYVCCNCGTERT